jgi:lipid II:glycine glycyltransferase (peptidoglycan interpeptide bridge formation enzyme)
MNALIDALPPFDYFEQNFHPSVTNWLPFHWRGFEETTRYTYVLPDLTDVDAVWKGTRANVRTDVRKAEKTLKIRDDLGLDAFLRVHEMTFTRQGMTMPYGRDLVARIDAACAERGRRKILFAVDAAGAVHAAAYLVWDVGSAYYLMGGADPDLRNSGAGSLVVWEAIRFAATVAPAFDFEGSMIEPIERFFRAFGAEQRPYFHVTKTSSRLLKMRRDLRSWMTP